MSDMIKQAYQHGVLAALNELGLIQQPQQNKTAGVADLLAKARRVAAASPGLTGAAGGAGLGALGTAVGGGDLSDVLLGAGVGGLGGAAAGKGLQKLLASAPAGGSQGNVARAIRQRLGMKSPSESYRYMFE